MLFLRCLLFVGFLFSPLPPVLELTVSLTELQLSKHTRTFKEILIDRTWYFSQMLFLATFPDLKYCSLAH
jgi:Mg2+/citrate symporter